MSDASLNADTVARYSCESCGCDVTKQTTLGGSTRWVDTRGNSLCPAWTATFHAPNPVALPIVERRVAPSGTVTPAPEAGASPPSHNGSKEAPDE